MPSPSPNDRERLTSALHLYSLASRPLAADLVRLDGYRFLHAHEITDHWEGIANRPAVRRALGLTRLSHRPMGRNKYLAALREVVDGEDAARWTRRGPSNAKVNLFLAVTRDFDREHNEDWLALFQGLHVADDWDDIDGHCQEMGLDLAAPLPPEFVYTQVPDVDPFTRRCRGACNRLLPRTEFRERSDTGGTRAECLECEREAVRQWKIANRDRVAFHSREQRERYEEANLKREAEGRASEVYPDEKRCDDCRCLYTAPVGHHFHPERARPDGLSRHCKTCTAKASDRRRHPTSNH